MLSHICTEIGVAHFNFYKISCSGSAFVLNFSRDPAHRDIFLAQVAKEKPPLTVVGDVGGRIAIMVVSVHQSEYLFFHCKS